MYKVSVIMPIFNAGEYLENTLNSVINQTIGFENIELILVDDCSTDNSKDIIEKYSNSYPNIKKIFLEENTGCPGIPRNIGIKNATSDYVMFIDNDDEYFPEICDKLYNTMILEDTDIVVCNALGSNDCGENFEYNVIKFSWNSERTLLNEDIIYLGNVFVWNCIFKKSIIIDNNLEFIDSVSEDAIFILEYSIHSKKLIYLNDYTGYHHIQRKESASNFSLDKLNGQIDASYIIAGILEKNNKDLNRFFRNRIRLFISDVVLCGNKDEKKVLFSNLHDFEKKINFNGNLTIGFKLINYFILHGNLNLATYMALFFSRLLNSNLIENMYRKLVLKK